MSKQYAVIGLGRFGSSVATELYQLNNDVIGIDLDENRIEENIHNVTHAVQADATEEAALKSLGLGNYDVVVIAIGENIQASILASLIVKELGVETIVVKAQNNLHSKVLYKIGVTKVIFPERDMGLRVAHNLVAPNILDYIELSDDYSIVELLSSEKIIGKSLVELDIRAKFGCNVIALKNGEEINIAPNADDLIAKGDVLVVIGSKKNLQHFEVYVTGSK